jgi:hypothetical protein
VTAICGQLGCNRVFWTMLNLGTWPLGLYREQLCSFAVHWREARDVRSKGKVKLLLCFFNWVPRHEGVLEKWMYSSTHSLTSALDGGGCAQWNFECMLMSVGYVSLLYLQHTLRSNETLDFTNFLYGREMLSLALRSNIDWGGGGCFRTDCWEEYLDIIVRQRK